MDESENNTKALQHPLKATASLPDVATEAVIPVREILGARQEIILLHAGQRYRLRLTSNDRLILTK